MYKFNSDSNELEKVFETTFLENDLKERNNIEEWIRKDPSILKEDLLIIAHEYNKFEVNERLDLLGLDKDGNLVIIEVKRDESGGEFDFQALKYCSYCSTLTPTDILEIYTEYLNKFSIDENAVDNLLEFFDVESQDLLNGFLNIGQRIIIIGREIDRRILSVSAWLAQNSIDIKCMTIVPYTIAGSNELIIDVNQLIPAYSINDFFINKKKVEKSRGKLTQPDKVINFFTNVVNLANKKGHKAYYYNRKSYAKIRSQINSDLQFVLAYRKRDEIFRIKVEGRDKAISNKLLSIYNKYKAEIQSEIKQVLRDEEGSKNSDWLRIYMEINCDGGSENLSSYVEEVGTQFIEFVEVFKKYLAKEF
ncbi:MAG: hypothetical protein FH758_03335 [Firmicutes bacterium]|nr:hypothetical protein [Bacillota bacterium]